MQLTADMSKLAALEAANTRLSGPFEARSPGASDADSAGVDGASGREELARMRLVGGVKGAKPRVKGTPITCKTSVCT